MKNRCGRRPLLKSISIALLTALCAVGVFCCLPKEKPVSARAEGISSLEGYGSWEVPYLIEDVEDLITFRNEVNAGITFENCYVKQTADLNLDVITNFEGIGNEQYAFEGLYEGAGHTISNLNIRGRTGGAALFYRLEGTVRNLGITGGTITGNYAASFALTSGEDALILNCYSTARVAPTVRGGGIVDDFSGSVQNCWYYCVSSENIPLVGKDCASVYYGYAKQIAPADAEGYFSMCRAYQPYFFSDEAFVTVLNRGRTVCAANNFLANEYLSAWTLEGNAAFSDEVLTWQGKGTMSDPYLVSSAEDLVLIAVCVNAGEEFRSKYFKQTADIDLSSVYNFVPIGLYDSDRYFFGTYDGASHTLSNLFIGASARAYNNGLFGVLGGTVKNLGIESGRIYGANCASFSSHAYDTNALVLNCYSKANVYGQGRSGGIVDNFRGKVYNCVYYNFEQPTVLLCSYTAYDLRNCYSTGGVCNQDTFTGVWQLDNEPIYSYTNREQLTEKLNSWIIEYAQSHRSSYSEYAEWTVSADTSFDFSGTFRKDGLDPQYHDIISRYYTNQLVVMKLALCSLVLIVLTIVIEVLLRKRKAAKTESERHGDLH